MASKVYYSPFIPTFSGNGLPVANARLYFFYTGTTDLAPIFQDAAMTIPMENPVISDGAARYPNIYLDEAITYRVRETGEDGVPLAADIDPYVPGMVLVMVPDIPEFADPGGSAMVGNIGPLTGEVAQTVATNLNQEPITFERFGGGTSENGFTAADNDAAWLLIVAQLSGVLYAKVQLFEGNYQISDELTLPANASSMTIEGEGFTSVLRQMTAGQHIIAMPSGGTAHNFALRNLTMRGPGWNSAGTAHGFYMPANAVESFNMLFEDLYIYEVSGDCLSVGTQAFTAAFRRVGMDLFGRHGIYGGNNTWTIENCYAHNAKGTDLDECAAFRITGGTASFTGDNGLDSGDVWGDFGLAIADGDAIDSYANIKLDGCNVEDFAKIGGRVRNGSVQLINSGFLLKAGAVNGKALLLRPSDGAGIGGLLTNVGSFVLKAGATWANSLPVHTVTNDETPFALILGGSDPTETFEWYDEATASTKNMPITRLKKITATKWGAAYTDVNLGGIISTLNTAGNATVLQDFADDAAAAAGGIAVAQAYRTGSITKVRVA